MHHRRWSFEPRIRSGENGNSGNINNGESSLSAPTYDLNRRRRRNFRRCLRFFRAPSDAIVVCIAGAVIVAVAACSLIFLLSTALGGGGGGAHAGGGATDFSSYVAPRWDDEGSDARLGDGPPFPAPATAAVAAEVDIFYNVYVPPPTAPRSERKPRGLWGMWPFYRPESPRDVALSIVRRQMDLLIRGAKVPTKGGGGRGRRNEYIPSALSPLFQEGKARVHYAALGDVDALRRSPSTKLRRWWRWRQWRAIGEGDDGDEEEDNETKLPGCPPRACRRIKPHVDEGNESLTLSAMHNFCSSSDVEPSRVVLYLHDKGSSHDRGGRNALWGLNLIAAAASSACFRAVSTTADASGTGSGSCNACALRFGPLPYHHFPGNVFLTTCGYVKKLLRPESFLAQIEKMYFELINGTDAGALYDGSPNEIGASTRHYVEHWIASHPSLVPCDMYDGPYVFGYDNLPVDPAVGVKVLSPDAAAVSAPRFGWEDYAKGEADHRMGDKVLRKHGFFRLKGRMFEWRALYGEGPPQNNWAWEFYRE